MLGYNCDGSVRNSRQYSGVSTSPDCCVSPDLNVLNMTLQYYIYIPLRGFPGRAARILKTPEISVTVTFLADPGGLFNHLFRRIFYRHPPVYRKHLEISRFN